jgi:hypothetical protein
MSDKLTMKRFEPDWALRWNQFVQDSKNGTFLFDRCFMGYHEDRFTDHSLMVLDEDKLVALLPANQNDSALFSHGGLTYGGFITNAQMRADLMLEIFEQLAIYARQHQISRLVYKPVPHFYHRQGAEEDLYALFRANARQIRVDIASAIKIPGRPSFSKSKRQGARAAKTAGAIVAETQDWPACWAILEDVLDTRHGARPIHTLDEITILKTRFPDKLRLFGAFLGDDMISALVMFDCGQTVHVQYIASSALGREIGGVDVIVDHLLTQVYHGRQWFDFGISTVDQGRELNVGLARQKEMFGARSVIYQHFEMRF